MKVTKFVHACLLVEMPAPVNRTVLFDPGVMSEGSLNVDSLSYLDDIVITHSHSDHMSMKLMKQLVSQFPSVRILSTAEVVQQLVAEGITATSTPPDGMKLFSSPHENVEPMFPNVDQIGVHYLDVLSHPGDSHSFAETKPVLAFPVTAPWGSTVTGVQKIIELKPDYVLPIHDWHWSDTARTQMYGGMTELFKQHNIRFISLETAEPVVLDV